MTADDLVEALLDGVGVSAADGLLLRRARRSIINALADFGALRNWSYFVRPGKLITNAPYSTGTIQYTHSTKTVTLTSGTFPSWAANGWLKVSGKVYLVKSRTSGTALVLDDVINPGSDIAAGTSYTLFQDAYALPYDFGKMLSCVDATQRTELRAITPEQMQRIKSNDGYQTGTPDFYSIQRGLELSGTLALTFQPISSTNRQVDYLYVRRQPPIKVWKETSGTVTVSAGGTTVTGSGTAFTDAMIGSSIRFGTASALPTALEGLSPYSEERVITAVSSSTSLTVDEALDSAYTSVKYVISSLVDIDPMAMRPAILALAGYNLAVERNADSAELSRRLSVRNESLRLAMQADRRYSQHDFGQSFFGGGRLAMTPTNSGYPSNQG